MSVMVSAGMRVIIMRRAFGWFSGSWGSCGMCGGVGVSGAMVFCW